MTESLMMNVEIDKPWLMLGDCLERMKEIPDGSVDMIAADLPYAATLFKWDSMIPLDRLWAQYRRVIKQHGAIVLTATQPFTTVLINSNSQWFKYCWVWEKTIVGDVFNAKNKPLRKHEDILVFSEGTTANKSNRRMPYYPQGLVDGGKSWKRKETIAACRAPRPSHAAKYTQTQTGYPTSVLRFPNETGLHPTQKPVPLFEYLIRTYTNPGEVVLDNCFGSGTTGVACVNTGRRFIGIERDPNYFDIGRRRIEAAIAAANQPAEFGGLFDAAKAAE